VWVYERDGTTWSQRGVKLTGAGEVGDGEFGYGVALSLDATTAIIGGIGDEAHVGAVWPFARVVPPEEPTEETTTTHPTTTATTTSSGPTPTVAHGVAGATFVSSPVLGVSGNVQPVSGKVLVKIPGHGFESLTSLRQIPFGSLVDATQGRVQVTTALPGGSLETGEFFDGQFLLTQGHAGIVTIQLTGGSRTGCSAPHHGRRKGRKAARASARRAKTVRKLWANAHGTFTTKGSYAAGAVQGTEWLTEDRCNGTYIRVTRDKVKVTDFVHHRTFIVLAGHSIFVKA